VHEVARRDLEIAQRGAALGLLAVEVLAAVDADVARGAPDELIARDPLQPAAGGLTREHAAVVGYARLPRRAAFSEGIALRLAQPEVRLVGRRPHAGIETVARYDLVPAQLGALAVPTRESGIERIGCAPTL
jgi:hypothetical protein